jgi:type I restriction enzyme S subunit
MSFPHYDSYKDSGVEWLGEVPQTWSTVPFWTLFRREKRVGFADEQLLSVYRNYGVIPKASRDDNFNNASEDLSTYQLVDMGYLAINKMKAWQGSVGISEHRGIVSPAYFVFRPTHSHDSRYLHYLMRSPQYIAAYTSMSKGIRVNQWDLDPEYHSQMPVLLPSRSEQTSIATFLDLETAKIDALVEEQQRLIELLKEKRQAVISHAVTKGLDPSALMRDSNVEWLGDIPAHWTVQKLRSLTTEIGDGLHGTPEYVDQSSNYFINGNNLVNGHIFITDSTRCVSSTEAEKHAVPLSEKSVLMSINGTIGNLALYRGESIMLGKSAAYINCDDELHPEFLFMFLQASPLKAYFDLEVTGTTISNLSLETLRDTPIALPPADEQVQIAGAISEAISQIDCLVAEAERGILLLQERRSALISAAVTGKIDVRSLVPAEAEAA